MDAWQAYPDAATAAASRRYTGTGGNQLSPRDYNNGLSQQQPQPAYPYANALVTPGQQNAATSPANTPQLRDGNGDIAMQDTQDPHGNVKFPIRSHHQHHLSGSGRAISLHSPQESSAAQRYSPMQALSPTSPYGPKVPGGGQYIQSPVQRHSPTRSSDYNSQAAYFNVRSQVPQLPPINPYAPAQDGYQSSTTLTPMDGTFGDPKSPRRMPAVPTMSRGPVPEFKKLRALTDLRPKVNQQPPFRRANPEGGFISVCDDA
jgi:dual specificity protein kinase YAK1